MSSQNECSGCGGGGAGAGTTVGGNAVPAVASQAGGMLQAGDCFIFVPFDFRVASDFPTMATSNWSVAFFASLLLIV